MFEAGSFSLYKLRLLKKKSVQFGNLKLNRYKFGTKMFKRKDPLHVLVRILFYEIKDENTLALSCLYWRVQALN